MHQKTDQHDDEEHLPALSRRMSLSKSGRMKERKRSNVSVLKKSFESNDQGNNNQQLTSNNEVTKEERRPSLPSSDIFDMEGIEKAIKEHDQGI